MYVPNTMRFPSEEAIAVFIKKYSFATIVSSNLEATRLPLVYDPKTNLLYGHFARANQQWKTIEGAQCLAIFDGPHDYISPTWYASKPAVPTWNYASVHIKGRVSLLTDDETAKALDMLIRQYEPALLVDRDTVKPEYQQKLSKGIVGFAMAIEHIDAKAKLGQHRSLGDQQGVQNGLFQRQSPDSQALLALMQQWQLGLGEN